jgi:hypothetical protein
LPTTSRSTAVRGIGVGLGVGGAGVDEGAGAWLDVGGADVGVAFKLFTTTEINAVLPG